MADFGIGETLAALAASSSAAGAGAAGAGAAAAGAGIGAGTAAGLGAGGLGAAGAAGSSIAAPAIGAGMGAAGAEAVTSGLPGIVNALGPAASGLMNSTGGSILLNQGLNALQSPPSAAPPTLPGRIQPAQYQSAGQVVGPLPPINLGGMQGGMGGGQIPPQILALLRSRGLL